MRSIFLCAIMALFVSASIASTSARASNESLMEFDDALLMKPLETWFKPASCAKDVGEYFYISLGKKDVSVFKIKRSMYRKASLSSWPIVSQNRSGKITGEVKKNMGCQESPMPVSQIFLGAQGKVDTGVQDDLFILRLDGNMSHDKHLIKLRDSGEAKEVHEGLLYFAGEQTLNGKKQPVAYFMAKDPKDLQKSGGPMRARCLAGPNPKALMCSVTDAINKDAVYEAVLPVWPPKLADIRKLHSQMRSFVDEIRVKGN